jgi:hypothetical protein
MAGGIIGGMWVLGLLLGLIIVAPAEITELVVLAQAPKSDPMEFIAISQNLNIFHIAPVIMSIATLSIVLLGANMLRLVFRRNQTIVGESVESVQETP